MKVHIQWDKKAIQQLADALEPAANKTIQAVHDDVVNEQVMPFDLGDMQNNATFTEAIRRQKEIIARLVTGAPQARRLYYNPEYNFQTVHNPKAGGYWLLPWIEGERKEFIPETFAKIYKQEAGL